MSSPQTEQRDALVAGILRATADLAAGRAAFGARVAERHGLAGIDVEVLRQLATEGAMAVGRIGELTALTTGATTRMVDRLEQAGFVRRVADPADRRRVIVEPVPERAAAVVSAYAPLEETGRAALDALDDTALDGIRAYLDTCVAATRPGSDTTAPAAASPDGATVGAPVASATAGRLVFVTAAPAVTIRGSADLAGNLFRARIRGAVPSARARDGVVTIRYPRFAWFDWRARVGDQFMNASAHWKRDTTELVLNTALPWSVELRGGSTSITADLRDVRLTGFTMAGGSGSVGLTLGHPTGVVRVRLKGGIGDVLVTRPAGTPVVLVVKGGARKATLDGEGTQSHGRIATPGAESAIDRFEIEVSGGANRVAVTGA